MTPALKSEIIGIVCHYLNTPYDINLEPLHGHTDRWATYCPVHEANRQGNPSLHVYVGLHSQTQAEEMHFKCMSRGCEPGRIKDCLERDGLLKKTKNTTVKRNWEVNVPPHAEPDWETERFKDWPVTDHWAFLNVEGQVVFWHIRTDNPNKKKTAKTVKTKEYSRIYSVTDKDTGKKFFAHTAILKTKPIPYNAYFLQQRTNDPVLIVEGPKTADAATKLFPEFVVLTWDEGAANFNKFDWSLLQGRTSQIILFPDNDEPGIKAMRGLAKILVSMDLKPQITFSEMLPAPYPEGWDLADETPKNAIGPETLLEDLEEIKFTEEELNSLKSNVELTKALEKLDERFVAVHNGRGEFAYYDIENIDMFSKTGCPYYMYTRNGLKDMIKETYYDQDNDEEGLVIDAWLEQTRKIYYHSLTYDPSTKEKTIKLSDNINYLNIFTGFATEPIESSPEESKWFTDHIYKLQGFEEGNYTIDYIADMIQNPGRKPGTMMHWTGTQGNGKSFIGQVIVRLLGQINATILNANILAGQFTSEYAAKLFIMPEEMPESSRARESIDQTLKFLVTTDYTQLNAKHMSAYSIKSFHRVVITSNNISTLKMDEDERRTTVIQCKSDHLRKVGNMINDAQYFIPLYTKLNDRQAIGKLMYYLKNREIKNDIMKPYITIAKQNIQRPKDPVNSFVLEVLDTGILPNYCYPFANGWPVQDVIIPRRLVRRAFHEYCKLHNLELPNDRIINQTLLKLLQSPNKSSNYSNYFKMINDNGIIEVISDRIYEFQELNKHRKVYEEMTETKPAWSEIDTHEQAIKNQEEQLKNEANVVPMKSKSKDETIL